MTSRAETPAKSFESHHSMKGAHPLLGASHDEISSSASTFSAMSALMWGLVLQKARKGVEAAGSKDTQTVQGLLKKGVVMICMIAAASLCTYMGSI